MVKKNKIAIIGVVVALLAFLGLLFGESDTENTKPSENESTAYSTESKDVFQSEDIKEPSYTEEEKEENIEKPTKETEKKEDIKKDNGFNLNNIPAFSGKAYVAINGNKPNFNLNEKREIYFETYSPLDYLGRCTLAEASLGLETMPKKERGEIGMVKPSGWHTVKYDCVNGKYLYNRCHLIGFQLSGENANDRNLITGTRFLNVEGMLPFENMVADYIKETENHVLYRVKPIFKDSEKVARGVQIEAMSVEDKGEGICFNVYCYNNQPGVKINYETGESELSGEVTNTPKPTEIITIKSDSNDKNVTYIINKNSKIFHKPSCSSVKSMSEKNKMKFKGSKKELLENGYKPCKRCKP